MNDVQILLSLIEIATKAAEAIKSDNPEAYAAIGQHHSDALARLEAAAAG
jgi:hypothetical protein